MERKTLQKLSSALSKRDPDLGEYLTDGCKLYRVVALRTLSEEALVELEDCRALDVWLVSADELNSLRRVRGPKAGLPPRGGRTSSSSPPGPRPGW